jgi:hypothetical protein
MTTPEPQVRRATVDDVPQLVALWKHEGLPWKILERQFKDFQVAVDAAGTVLGALGLQVAGPEGRVHHEIFARAEQADALRDRIWQRLQIVARNQGLVRLWTQLDAPFWRHTEMSPAPAEILAKLPAAFGSSAGGWHYLQLREEGGLPAAVETELALFKALSEQETQQTISRARALKTLASLLALLIFVPVIVWAILSLIRSERGGRR